MPPLRNRSTPREQILLLSALIGVTACACGEGTPESPAAIVRDSAGITLVESPALGPGADLGWMVDSVPLTDIGTLDGPSETQLYRVLDAKRLRDGSIAVLNAGTGEVRIFSSDAAHRRTLGGQGSGPGEFTRPASLHLWPGDSLGVWDARARRITLFAADGSLGRTLSLPRTEGGLPRSFSHRLPGGELAVLSFDLLADGPQNGYRRIPVQVEHLDGEGAVIADLGIHPGGETVMTLSGEAVSITTLPFARGFVVAPHASETMVAPNDRLELRYFDAWGSLLRIARVADPPRLATVQDREAELQRRLAGAPEEAHPGIRTQLREHPGPDTLPAFTSVMTDAAGDTWIETFRSPADSGPGRWIVLGPDGGARGTVSLPAGIEVFEIGLDWILGLWTDDLDVEHVRLWRLVRGEAGDSR